MSRLFALGVVAVCLAVVGCSGKGKATKANFDKVKEGMSVKEVEDLMGAPKESVTIDAKELFGSLGGNIPGMGDLGGAIPKMTIKMWEDSDSAYVISFKDDKVQTKASGSKEEMKKKMGKGDEGPADKVTRANYDKIKDGMSKADVEKILGPGKAKTGGGVEGLKGDLFVWEGDKIVITIGFLNDKVVSRLQASK